MSTDYRLPDGTYLFNSRFNQRAIKFSLAHRYRLQIFLDINIILKIRNSKPYCRNPAEINILDITSSSVDLTDDHKSSVPYQLVNNNLLPFNQTI